MSKDKLDDSIYYQMLQAEKEEIDKLKWIESEKRGWDIGRVFAVFLWSKKRKKWAEGFLERFRNSDSAVF